MEKEIQTRGKLTERVKAKSKELMGYEITVRELRLMPYIQFVMMNEQRLDPNKISSEERQILSHWREQEYIFGGASGLSISREFWDILCEILFLAYVDLDEDPQE